MNDAENFFFLKVKQLMFVLSYQVGTNRFFQKIIVKNKPVDIVQQPGCKQTFRIPNVFMAGKILAHIPQRTLYF
jgi:hypothetical protein